MDASPANPREVFLRAVENVDETDWEAFVREAAGENESLRADVMRLLAAHRRADDFMVAPAGDVLQQQSRPLRLAPGTHIGPYKLLEQIGEGGMGLVFVAEQVEPIRRRVALKVIKPGMDSQQVIARFEAERQALAMMDHPHIATVLDAGVSDIGLPYFVMELVRGLPITEYCDSARLTPDLRIRLFISVCQAVQHAHHKGIIHRDLKPSNVLVTLHDGRPVPKVIDFGVAKAIGQRLSERTIYTAFAQMVGTPLYMSPEQAELSALDVDTRSDVYSLGVMLYELLTGQTPFDPGLLKAKGLDEMRRIIREDEPLKPSLRVSTVQGQAQSTLSFNRGIDDRQMREVLRNDLDWIVMKALEKDRRRRYESASALAADLERYLCNEQVHACPPSARYRLEKLLRRRKRLLAMIASITLALTLGLMIATWQAITASRERNRANDLAAERNLQAQRAEELARQAMEKAALADLERARAVAAEAEQRTQTQHSEAMRYAGDIYLASRHHDAGDDEQAKRLLDRWLPAPGTADRRGIEWALLRQELEVPGSQLMSLPGDVSSVRSSPDHRSLVSATDGGTIKRLELQTGKQLPDWETGLTDVRRMEFSADGLYLALISYEAEVVVLSSRTGEIILHCPRPETASASPDVCFWKNLLLTTGRSNIVSLWNLETGELEQNWTIDCSEILDVVARPQSDELLLLTTHSSVPTYSVQFFSDSNASDAARNFNTQSPPSVLAISLDGQHFAVGSTSGDVEIYDVTTLRQLAAFHLSEKINEMCFSSDGQYLAAVERTGVAHVWSRPAATFDARGMMPWGHKHWNAHARPARSIIFAPDARQVVTAGFDGHIICWDWNQQPGLRLSTDGQDCRAVVLLRGARAAATVTNQELFVFDLHQGSLLKTLPLPSHGATERSVATDDSGNWLAVAAEGREILCANLQIGQRFTPLPASDLGAHGVAVLEFLPGSLTLVAAELRPSLRLRGWDADRRQLLFDHTIQDIAPVEVCPSPVDRGLIVATEDSLLQVDLASGDVLRRRPFRGGDVSCLALSPDSHVLAVARKDKTLVLLDAVSGEQRLEIVGHRTQPDRMRFSDDGQTLLTIDGRGELHFWHVSSGLQLLTWPSQSPIKRFDLTRDNEWLAIGHRDDIEVIRISD